MWYVNTFNRITRSEERAEINLSGTKRQTTIDKLVEVNLTLIEKRCAKISTGPEALVAHCTMSGHLLMLE